MSLKQAPEQTGLPPAEPVELAKLVAYQAGGVVSRTLVQKSGGTVTVFAFDQGQALSEHTAPFDAVVQVLDGETELVIGGKSVPAQAGQTVLMPANIPHAVNATTKFKMLLIMIRDAKA
jgi:quercetin dioxygenase-like cupin family protein